MISLSRKSLDYEEIQTYNLIVEAKDQAYYSKSSTTSVKVVLQDINDNIPKFMKQKYSANLKENSPINATVTQMLAHDKDSRSNAIIEYEIIGANEDFFIEKDTGFVKALRSFDFELTSSIDMSIRARNLRIT